MSSWQKTVKDYLLISIGLLLYVLAWTIFIIPNHLVGGGCTGISAIIQYATGFNISYTYFLLNAVLLVLGIRILGKGFGAKTVYAVIFCSVAFKFVPMFIPKEFIQQIAVDNGKMLCVLFGGALSGLGTSMAIRFGGSTGGTDIIALMVNKYHNISTGTLIVAMDIIIISSSLLIPSDASWGERFANVVYGFVCSGVSSISLDYFIMGSKQSVQMLIFSDKYEKIADRIIGESRHGVSVFDAEGWYTKAGHRVLLVVVRKTEMNHFLMLIKEEDPSAFVSVGNVHGVYGMGFEQIKK